MEHFDQKLFVTGSVRWADFGASGYQLRAVDGCGEQLLWIASVEAKEISAEAECCSQEWNAWRLEHVEIPETAKALAIFGEAGGAPQRLEMN